VFVCPSAVTASLVAFTLTAGEPVTIATEGTFEPYIYVDSAGTITGFEKDIADEICRRAVFDCSWLFVKFDDLLPGVAAGRFNIALGGLAVTEERLELVDFSLSYFESNDESWYIGPPGAPGPDDGTTGVQSGTIYETHLRKLGRAFIEYSTSDEQVAGLLAGEVDLILGPLPVAVEEKLTGQQGMVYHDLETVPDQGTAMAICKGNIELKARIDNALQEMTADGTLNAITDRWFPL
jgi:polar amino acid transport system substrate-binding protein